jgi:hypothetical protein
VAEVVAVVVHQATVVVSAVAVAVVDQGYLVLHQQHQEPQFQ